MVPRKSTIRITNIVTALAVTVPFVVKSAHAHSLPQIASQSPASLEYTYDVVVVGAGAGGVSAAIQAARLNASVALLEETNWVGGQMTTAAVSTMDGGILQSNAGTGLFYEFIEAVRDYYDPRPIGTCYHASGSRCFEPKVGRAVLEAMLSNAGVDVYLNTSVTSALVSGNTVQGVTTTDGDVFYATVTLDGTEYGDLIPLTPAEYRVGNHFGGEPPGTDSCVQDITYNAVVKHYPGGPPAALDMTRQDWTEPPGYDDARLQFATYVTQGGSDPGHCPAGMGGYPFNWNYHKYYRGLPDSSNPQHYDTCSGTITKTVINWANDYPGGSQGGPGNGILTTQYIENPTTRTSLDCAAKLRTLQFLYYMQNELGATNWAVANDEGYDSPNFTPDLCLADEPGYDEYEAVEKHLPLLPYVRESRRIVPMQTLRAADIIDEDEDLVADQNFLTAVAVNDYRLDLHRCNDPENLEDDLGEDHYDPGGRRAFQIPFETIIPAAADGLLPASKSIGTSRLANGSTRLQPAEMLIGQAAGTIAALAVANGVQPRNVSVWDVQKQLLEDKSGLSRFGFQDVSIDDPAWAAVQLTSLYGILTGYAPAPQPPWLLPRMFGIDDAVTRAQLAVIATRLIGVEPCPTCGQTFADVPSTHWAYGHVEAAYQEGIFSGCLSNPLRFCPADTVTRVVLAVIFVNALDLENESYPDDAIFSDVPPTHWAFPYVQIAATKGLMLGCTANSFCPTGIVNRRQAAHVISRAIELQHTE